MALFQMVCNSVTWPCGCGSWHELESGAWVRKHWSCWQHEEEPCSV